MGNLFPLPFLLPRGGGGSCRRSQPTYLLDDGKAGGPSPCSARSNCAEGGTGRRRTHSPGGWGRRELHLQELQEVAAYLLLLDDGKAGVPTTAVVQVVFNPVFNFKPAPGRPRLEGGGPAATRRLRELPQEAGGGGGGGGGDWGRVLLCL